MENISMAWCLHIFPGDQCFPYDIPIQRLNMDAGAWVNVFLDIPIECDQRVRGWQYHTTSLGIFYAGIWRPTRGGTHLQLVGKNRISPRNDGTGVRYFLLIFDLMVLRHIYISDHFSIPISNSDKNIYWNIDIEILILLQVNINKFSV